MKLPILSGRQIVAALERLGFVEVHRRGSHVKMRHQDGRIIVFPYHDQVDRFTLRGALRDVGVELDRFFRADSLTSRMLGASGDGVEIINLFSPEASAS